MLYVSSSSRCNQLEWDIDCLLNYVYSIFLNVMRIEQLMEMRMINVLHYYYYYYYYNSYLYLPKMEIIVNTQPISPQQSHLIPLIQVSIWEQFITENNLSTHSLKIILTLKNELFKINHHNND